MAKILGWNISVKKNQERPVPFSVEQPLPPGSKRAPGFRITPYQLQRERIDVLGWREAIREAESPWNPYRVKMQKMYQDTHMNEHLWACIEKRKDLTMLRKFKLCGPDGIEDVEATNLLRTTWFSNFQSYTLDALFYGYNLIKLGDVINNSLPKLSFIRRANISPDRMVVTSQPYIMSGTSWEDPAFRDWFIYVSTPTETGVSPCGYGILYRIAKTEILLRGNTGYNADYNEVEGIPLLVMKTDKQTEERNADQEAFLNRGHNPSIIVDKNDEIEKVEGQGAGRGFLTYSDFEKRLQALISKIILGHANALDPESGKMTTEGEKSPAQNAMKDKQTKDGEFMTPYINDELLPRLRILGFNIPDDLNFEYLNDEEKEEFREREDASNQATATVMKTISDAGGEPDWDWFNERTGMKVDKKEVQPPDPMKLNELQTKLKTATSSIQKKQIERQIKMLQ